MPSLNASPSTLLLTLLLTLLTPPTTAKTDIANCVSSQVITNGGASLLWYLPSNGEICELLDCGGGRAPPKTDVPGCAAYEGTEQYQPRYIPGYQQQAEPNPAPAQPTPDNAGANTESSVPVQYGPPSTLQSLISPTTAPLPSSSSVVAATPELADTTTTLGGAATPSLVTSALVFDTAAPSNRPVLSETPTGQAPPALATGNAAARWGVEWGWGVVGVGAVVAGLLGM